MKPEPTGPWPRWSARRAGARNELWVSGEATDFSELDPERDFGQRRRDR